MYLNAVLAFWAGIYAKPIFKHSVAQGERDLKVFKSINS